MSFLGRYYSHLSLKDFFDIPNNVCKPLEIIMNPILFIRKNVITQRKYFYDRNYEKLARCKNVGDLNIVWHLHFFKACSVLVLSVFRNIPLANL